MHVLGDAVGVVVYEPTKNKTGRKENTAFLYRQDDNLIPQNLGFTQEAGEIGPLRKEEGNFLLRSYNTGIEDSQHVEVIDLESLQSITGFGNFGEMFSTFAQTGSSTLTAVAGRKFINRDKRAKDEGTEIPFKIGDAMKSLQVLPVPDSAMAASLCKHNGALKITWLRNDGKFAHYIKEAGMALIHHFDCFSDFQLVRSDRYVIIAVSGYLSTSRNGIPSDKDRASSANGFVYCMLFDLKGSAYPTMVQGLKCIPPVAKLGAPKKDYAICAEDGVFTIRATWSPVTNKTTREVTWSDRNIVVWTIDPQEFEGSFSSINGKPKEVVGTHMTVSHEDRLFFDNTLSVKASSVDPNSFAGFFQTPEGSKEMFYPGGDAKQASAHVAGAGVVTWDDRDDRVELDTQTIYNQMNKLRLVETSEDEDDGEDEEDKDPEQSGIIPMFTSALKYWTGV